jgi:hypothetical protein
MVPIGRFGSQEIEFNEANGHIYVGGRKAEPIWEAIQRRNRLKYSLNLTHVNDQHLAQALAKSRLKLSELDSLAHVKDKDRFLSLLTHTIAHERPSGRSEEDRETRTILDSILDDARAHCNTNGRNGHK